MMDQSFEVLKEIPLFDGLTPANLQQIHNLCNLQQFSAGVTICEAGSASTEMFILLEGNLAVCTSGGFEVARISPVGVVGEMGLFTGEPRSADVLTTDGVIVFQIRRDTVRELFVKHREICVRVLRNVIRILSQKINHTNSQIEDLKNREPDHRQEIEDIMSGNIFLS